MMTNKNAITTHLATAAKIALSAMTNYDSEMMDMLPNRRLSDVIDEDDEVYDNYVEDTVDPGQSLFFLACFICLGSVLGLPLFVKVGTFFKNRKHDDADADSDGPNLSCIQRCRKMSYATVLFVVDHLVQWRRRGAHTGENMETRRKMVSRGIQKEAQQSVYVHQREALVDAELDGSNVEMTIDPSQIAEIEREKMPPAQGTPPENEHQESRIEIYNSENSASSTSPSMQCSGYVRKRCRFVWTIAKYDNETKRLMRLAVPFTLSAMVETMSELITLAIISNYVGTDSMVAYAMVSVIIGISSSFMGGWVEAISSLGSMAYGAENYELLGQYVQTSCIGYVLGEIPFAFIWGMSIGKIMLLMDFEESVAMLAQDFVYVAVAISMMMGINEAVMDFLEVVEKEKFANFMFCLCYIVQLGLVSLFAIQLEADLVVLGLVMLTNQALFFFLNVLIPNKLGWLRHFEFGLFGQCSLRNKSVLKELFQTALPLAFGSLLAYAEWEVLTIFAAFLGPAEAATWAILGFVWDLFESTTEAIGDASEIRVAYQLGKGRPELAKLASYKSVMMAACLAFSVTGVFLGVSSYLPAWLTKDETIQTMLVELFPLIALGNVTMNMGMVCWALVGAQGRYRLATTIAVGSSLLITLPVGAIMTLWLKINLQGLTFAVVVGYSTSAMLLSIVLLMSDWEMLSEKIQERMEEEDSDSDSDDDSSSSSSNSGDESSANQASQYGSIAAGSIAVGSFVIPPATPGTMIPPPPPPPPRGSQPGSGTARFDPYRSMSSSPRPLGAESPGTPRTPTRQPRYRPMTPDQKKAESLAKLRTLSKEHSGLSLPGTPGSPVPAGLPNGPGSPMNSGQSITPGSPNASRSIQSNFGRQTSEYSTASNFDGGSKRVVKGRRRRIH